MQAFGSSRIDRYDGEIRFTDLHVGRLLAHLRASGLWGRTAVVLTGDHGEGFGEHGVTEHGFDLYPAQTKVPFIVRVPGLAPRRARIPVGHIDIAPTLVNLARGQSQPPFIGRSLVPDVAGPPAADTETRAVFQEVTSERGKKRALVTATRHLIWNAVPGDTTECYDRSRDPAEERDIWQVSGDTACAALARDLRRLVAGLALPPGAAEKLARGVAAPGAPAPTPAHNLTAAGAAPGRRDRGAWLRPVRPRSRGRRRDRRDVSLRGPDAHRRRVAAVLPSGRPGRQPQPGPHRGRRADAARALAPGPAHRGQPAHRHPRGHAPRRLHALHRRLQGPRRA